MLYKKGAEANLFIDNFYGKKIIKKCRFKKSYRNEKLDYYLRKSRTFQESRLLVESRKVGVATPFIYLIDVKNTTIYMEFIEGPQLKAILNTHPNKFDICERLGEKIGVLHKNNIIHGDLTTSNLILSKSNRIFFIDFGLGEFSTSLEDKGVDLNLMWKALESTHYKLSEKFFKVILSGYGKIIGKKQLIKIENKLDEIRLRGRYFDRS
ncbi:MAG: Kae1-associated serine/threonine protein kinase [Candidatus Lokiarchaeota archaeon]|nr:Kae1-associated serine/threonine protein kinase [Candidatus Lokiarchaeota archaeon]